MPPSGRLYPTSSTVAHPLLLAWMPGRGLRVIDVVDGRATHVTESNVHDLAVRPDSNIFSDSNPFY